MTNTGSRNVATRIVNAEEGLIETLSAIGGITRDEAHVVFAAYRKARAVKLDAVIGRYDVKHGAFLDREVIRRAAGVEE